MTYSSAAQVNKQKYSTRGQNAVNYSFDTKRLGPISNSVAILIMICLIGLVYLTQVTKTNTFSYKIDQLEQKQSELKEEQKDLELAAARLKGLDSAKVTAAGNTLVSVAPTGTIQN